jgi:hypothetical protein
MTIWLTGYDYEGRREVPCDPNHHGDEFMSKQLVKDNSSLILYYRKMAAALTGGKDIMIRMAIGIRGPKV